MAVVIESTTSTASLNNPVTDAGSTGTFLVTKPIGLVEGELLIVIAGTDVGNVGAGASGFTEITIPSDIGGQTAMFYKYATVGDVAASNFTFATSSDNSDYGYVCYRISGAATSGEPTQKKVGDTDSIGEGTYTAEPISVPLNTDNVPSGSLVIMLIGKLLTGLGSQSSLSGYSVTGGSLTFTERFDAENSSDDDGFALADAISGSDITITAANFIVDSATLSSGETITYYTNLLIVRPQQDASATLSLTQTNNTAFTPAGSAGATALPTLTVTTNEAFAPNGTGTTGAAWSNATKPSTTWNNPDK